MQEGLSENSPRPRPHLTLPSLARGKRVDRSVTTRITHSGIEVIVSHKNLLVRNLQITPGYHDMAPSWWGREVPGKVLNLDHCSASTRGTAMLGTRR
jgi:hypothetical protein